MKKPVAEERMTIPAVFGPDSGWLALVVSLHVAAIAWMAFAVHPDKAPEVQIMSIQMLPMAPAVVDTPRPPKPPKPQPPQPKAPKPEVTRVKTTEAVKAAPLPEPKPEPRPVVEEKPVPSKPEPAPEPAMVQPAFQIGTLNNPQPDYPTRSQDLREQGRVGLRVLVGTDGRAKEVQIQRSSGFARLNEAARFTVLKRWKFTPARKGDEKIEAWATVNIDFNIDDEE